MNIDYTLTPGRKLEEQKYVKDDIEPIVSIITPYYNGDKYIEQTAYSVLNQTYPYFEWIIVDDGSPDENAREKLKEIEKMDSRIKILYKENSGPSQTRDYGINHSNPNSKYLMFLDTDDLITDTYIECAYWTLQTNPKASWTYTDVINFDKEEFLWRKWFNQERETKENILVLTAFVRKDAILSVNGFEIKEKKVYEDWYLWLKLIKNGYFPVRMSFLGFWYRKKNVEESELQQSNNSNKNIAMSYINKISREISYIKDKQLAIQYPKYDYKWEEIVDDVPQIIKKKRIENNKIKILIIMPWMVTGGADKFILDLISRIDRDKYEFIIITTEPSDNPWRLQFEEYAQIYDLTSFLNQKYWISFINYIIETNDIDIIFNTNSKLGYIVLPYLKARYPEKPIMDYIHMEEWYWRNGGFSRDSGIMNTVIDKTYLCNKNSEKILVNYFKRDPKDVSTVYIGVDEKAFNPNNIEKKEILKEFEIEKGEKFIISYICRIAEQKRPYLLIKIIAKLKEKRDDFIFVIAGDGPMLKDIKKEANKLNIGSNIIFLGNVKQTEKVYAISDLTINCSIKEGLALTAYESLSMGVPVISSDVGGQKELINEEVGVIVPLLQDETDIFNFNYKEDEINNYVKGIEKLLNNLEYYKKNCRNRILNGFTIDNMIENMSNIFKTIKENPNEEKRKNGEALRKNINITKELITRYFISTEGEYRWLSDEFNRNNIDINYKYEKNLNKGLYYENTLEYKIKHPIYLALKKVHLYDFCRKIIKRGE